MPLTIAQIAAKAMTAVSGAITDAVHPCALTRSYPGTYNVATDSYDSLDASWPGRAVFCNASAARDALAPYVIGEGEQVFFLEGLVIVDDPATPRKTDVLTVGGKSYSITAAQDIAGAGGAFYIAAQYIPPAA